MAKTDSSKGVFDLSPGAARPAPKGNNYLLAIGINAYPHFHKLRNAVRDVQQVVALLQEKYCFDPAFTRLLTEKEATRDQIIAALDLLVETVGENDNLIIYYSGHVHLNPKTERGYWLPFDAEPGKTARFISNSDLKDFLNDIPSRHTLLLSDACFSGSLFKGTQASASDLAIEELEQRRSRWALCSGRHDEKVHDGPPGGNSPFAASLLHELQANVAPRLNAMALVNKVILTTRQQYEQLPIGSHFPNVGDMGGQFVFHLKTNIAADFDACLSLVDFERFLDLHSGDGEWQRKAAGQVRRLRAEALWTQIQQAPDDTIVEIFQKNRLIDQYLQAFPSEPNFDAAAGLGEKLEWKEKFLRASESGKFALVRFLSGNPSFFKSEAEALRAGLRRKEIEADRQAEERRQQSEAERLQVEALAAEERRKKEEAKKAAEAEAERLRLEAIVAEEWRKKEEAKKVAEAAERIKKEEQDRLRQEALEMAERQKKEEAKKAADAAERRKKLEAQLNEQAEAAHQAAEAARTQIKTSQPVAQVQKQAPSSRRTPVARLGSAAFGVLALVGIGILVLVVIMQIWRPWENENGSPSNQATQLTSKSNNSETYPAGFEYLANDMVLVQGGKFQMGDLFGEGMNDEKPVHTVTLSSFYLSRYEVTNAQ
ncbi:MAG: SUMF1/EgtB/PvdO family nonheme iron enzyme, partial [Bacteroidota bacterium]